MIVIDDFEQLSEAWFQARLGNPGASNFDKIVTVKGEPSKQATEYMYQLAGEYVAKAHEVSFTTPWMERGTQLEAEARQIYEFKNDCTVRQVAMCYYDERRDRHASPDGLVDSKGVEIKCPMVKTIVGYLIGGKLPTTYFQQVQGNMYITGFDKWDFVSYYPGLPLFQVTIERDEKFISKLHEQLEVFICKLHETIKKITEMGET